MEDTGKISLSQLVVLLLLSRLFTIVTYTPDTGGLYAANMSPLSILLSGVAQVAALTLGIRLSHSPEGTSPMLLGEQGGKLVYRFIGGCYWLLAVAVCVYTGVSFTFFIVSNFYDFAYWWAVVLVLILSAGLAVRQGLEAVARSATIMGVIALAAFVLVAMGLLRQFDWLNYVYPNLTWGEELMEVYRGFAMNFELAAFLLLLPWVRDYKAPKGRQWIVWATVFSVVLQLTTTLTLGAYAEGKRFPIFTIVTTTEFLIFNRLDSMIMGVWVVLAFYKLAVFLQLAVSLFTALGYRAVKHSDIWIHSGLVAALVLVLLALTGLTSTIYIAVGAGVLTVCGVIVLPLVGWGLKQRGKRKREKASQ